MSNNVAMTKSRVVADALVKALLEHFAAQLVVLGGMTPIYTTTDNVGFIHVLLAGMRNLRYDFALLDRMQIFARGFLAAADTTSDTQGYEPNQTPMSVSGDWKPDGTGFKE